MGDGGVVGTGEAGARVATEPGRARIAESAREVLGKKEILRRFAPLDDGEKRFGRWTRRLGEEERLNPHPLREAEAQRVRHPAE
jgi:precorrin-6B methylase 1